MASGGIGRELATIDEVAGLLAVAERDWPDGGRVPSFSLHGLWRCVATRADFAAWSAATMRRGFGIHGVHHVAGTRLDGGPDVFVALLFGPSIATSMSPLGQEAQRVIGKALLQAIPMRGAALRVDAVLNRFVEVASARAGRMPPLDSALIRMMDGTLRLPTPPDLVADALDIRRRPIGSGMTASVSIHGLWSCTSSDLPCAAWFSRAARDLPLLDGVDHAPDQSAHDDVPAHLDLLAAKSLAAVDRSSSYPALSAAVEAAIRAAVDRPARRRAPDAATVAALAGTPVNPYRSAEDATSVDEPWAEAFDFGRLVPVAEREVGGVMQLTVSARDVHTFIASGRNFPTWFAAECERRKLTDGADYQIFNLPHSGQITRRGPVPTDYALILAAAKEIGMAGDGSRSKAIRRYFMEQERRFPVGEAPIPASMPPAPLPASPERVVVVVDRAVDPLFMSMASYLAARGFPECIARSEAAASAPGSAASVIQVDSLDDLRLVPGLGWMFAVAFLDKWWAHNRFRLLAALAGPPRMVPSEPAASG